MATELARNSSLVTHEEKPLTLLGTQVSVGEQAPNFKAACTTGVDVELSSLRGRTVILSIFPSINTPVCQVQARQFNKEASQLGESVAIVSVARDTVEDYRTFCAAEGISHLVNLSDLAYEDFGTRYGFLIEELQLLARGIVVIDPQGIITHVEYVPMLASEPDYAAALAAAKSSASEDAFVQLPLPYAHDALEPIISAQTISYHYGKHLQTYVTNLNALTAGSSYAGEDLISIICSSEGAVFNNAGQVYNHRLYFDNFSPATEAQTEPTGVLAEAINAVWGSYAAFQDAFEKAGIAQFGSGWVWLSADAEGNLAISSTANAGSPLTEGRTPLLTMDVWEHAYYLDYQNLRAKSLKEAWSIIDWKKVEARYASLG